MNVLGGTALKMVKMVHFTSLYFTAFFFKRGSKTMINVCNL